MKKIITLVLILCLIISLFGCTDKANKVVETLSEKVEETTPVETTQKVVETTVEETTPVETTQKVVETTVEETTPVETTQKVVETTVEETTPVETTQKVVETTKKVVEKVIIIKLKKNSGVTTGTLIDFEIFAQKDFEIKKIQFILKTEDTSKKFPYGEVEEDVDGSYLFTRKDKKTGKTVRDYSYWLDPYFPNAWGSGIKINKCKLNFAAHEKSQEIKLKKGESKSFLLKGSVLDLGKVSLILKKLELEINGEIIDIISSGMFKIEGSIKNSFN
jgi:hypothetical protein